MTRSRQLIFLFITAWTLGSNAAHADMTLVRREVYDDPNLKALGLPTVIENKIMVSGGKTRVEEPPLYFITDRDNRRSILLDSTHATYFVTPFSEQAPRAKVGMADAKTACELMPETKNLLGHNCHCYHLSLTGGSDRLLSVSADVYVAQDLPAVDVFSTSRGPAWILHEEFQRLPGMPLQMRLNETTRTGKMSVDVSVVSLSLSAVPASAFAVPHGYQRIAPPPPPEPPSSANVGTQHRINGKG